MSMYSILFSSTCRLVVRIAADGEQAAVHFWVQSLHSASQNFGKPGEIRDVADLEPGFPEHPRCAAG